MDEVKFNEPVFTKAKQASQKGLTQLLIKRGWARDETAAQKILVYVLGIAVVATIGVFLFSSDSPGREQPLPDDLIQ